MNFNFLSPVPDFVLAHNQLLSPQALGRKLRIHSTQKGIPDLDNVHIAILGVLENRNDINYLGEEKKSLAADDNSVLVELNPNEIATIKFYINKKDTVNK